MKTFVLLALFGAALAADDFDRQCAPSADPGPCKGYFPKWWYNVLSGQCELFVYGGCQGNDNKYDTQKECEETCASAASGVYDASAVLPEVEHRRRSKYTPNVTSEYAAVAVNAGVDFETYCKPKADIGPCKGYFPRWWFNVQSGQCEQFIYGGCQGNKNNFKSRNACETSCLRRLMSLNINATRNFTLPGAKVDNFACLSKPDQGPCFAAIPRYYFDNSTSTCKEFTYGGCEGNPNNYETVEQCKASCAPETEYEAKCLARPETGPCRAHMVMWAYDAELGHCKTFVYGGCDGNANRYRTQEECEATCKHPPTELIEEYVLASRQLAEYYNTTEVDAISIPDLVSVPVPSNPVCHLPKVVGMCLAYMPRYYYNNVTRQCERFVYGGCQGNENNFLTFEQCNRTCKPTNPVCYKPKKVGPCLAYIPRYFYNATTKYCERFIYGGCQGNGNNFPELEMCLKTCTLKNHTCYLPKDSGPCFGYFPRYYYNTTTNSCEQFIYGGCRGNPNNFDTLEKCQSKCTMTLDPVCELPKKVGPCRGYFPRYYYNTTTDTCEPFIYGGCQGNANNFETLKKCETRCGGTHIHLALAVGLNPVCNETKRPGPCAGYFPRYYFNNVTKTCERFIYGGCQGNGNNFHTLEECNSTCWVSPPEECTYPADSGPCDAYMPRFFFNTLTKSCEQFVYGGCGGNANNFRTFEYCQSKCTKFLGVIPRA
ncbi:hypothetical protein HPB49_011097 [Dermacentor silvarum]|uniref:Uncharacterized protein n=1 Tax=Dermacentor silvarum TaxID=543639 RepID=A0ACB8CEV0_DERSI|nr:hypothetical protein HPB49_011097 [Dermacentor silvarum]